MVAPRKPFSDLITTDCRLPRVVREMLAVKPGALAMTWKLPLLPCPSMLPLTPRLLSLQVPDSAPRSAMTLVLRSNL
jgi:hypothetical protein